MIELGATYRLLSPSEEIEAVINDPSHPSAIGWLRDISGLDSPEVRIDVQGLGQADGAFYAGGRGYYGARAITMEGLLIPGQAVEVNQREMLLRRATESLAADSKLVWWPSGYPELEIGVRRLQPLRVKAGRPRQWSLNLVAVDPRIYSREVVTRTTVLAEAPFVRYGDGFLDGPALRAGNVGTAYAPHKLRIIGPVTTPIIRLVETGEYIMFRQGYTIPAGAYVEIDVLNQTATRGGTENAYQHIVWESSRWFFLPPQSAFHIQMTGDGMTAETGLRITYRHTWM